MTIHNSAPCRDCQGRYRGCHSRCGDYAAWRSELEKKREDLTGRQERERMLNEFYADGCMRQIRKNGRKY